MQPLSKRLDILRRSIAAAYNQLAIDNKAEQVKSLETELSSSEIWNNPAYAQEKSKQLAALHAMVEPWQILKTQTNDITELMELGDESLLPEFEGQIAALEREFSERKKELLFNGRYDDHNAILRLSAGAGGTDAQDWTEMLERMYLRWAEKSRLDGYYC